MKIITLFALSILSLPAISQIENHKLELTYSNNGNLAKEIDRFYFNPVSEYGPGDDVYNYKEISYKFNLYYGIVIKSNWEVGLSAGFGHRIDKYDISNLPDWSGDKDQNYFSGALIAKYNVHIDRLEIGAGLEVPVSFLSAHTTNYYQDEPGQQAHFRTIVTGGMAFGINSYTSVNFYLTDWLYLTSKVSFGFAHLKAGGETKSELVSQTPDTYGDSDYTIENIYKKDYFSSPDFQIGLGWKF